jgi:anti-sigma factor RsiW
MECAEVRKKLKEYANDEIRDKSGRAAIESHVASCPVCKRELLMWQEVMDKQRAVKEMQSNMPKELKDRVKYRMDKSAKSSGVPPVLKKIKAFDKIWNTPNGMLIIGSAVILAPAIIIMVLFRNMHPEKSLLAPILVLFGFTVMFAILIFKRKK